MPDHFHCKPEAHFNPAFHRVYTPLAQRKTISAVISTLAVGGLILLGVPQAQGQTQTQMDLSAGRGAARADAAMNAAYAKLRAVLDMAQKAQLQQAQRAWLKFRDAEAALLSSKVKGGSVYPSVYALHIRAITQERTRELEHARQFFTTEGEM